MCMHVVSVDHDQFVRGTIDLNGWLSKVMFFDHVAFLYARCDKVCSACDRALDLNHDQGKAVRRNWS